jgi:hypothetical protein
MEPAMHGLSPHDEIDYWRERAEKAERDVLVLRHLVKRIDETLRVPAAEYVPAIGDAFTLIDALAKGQP